MTQTTNQAPTSPTRQHVPRGFIICMGAVLLTLVCAAVSLFDDREFYSDIFVEVSVFVVFVAGFFTNTRTLQFGYLLFANLYSIMFLAIFGKVFYKASVSSCWSRSSSRRSTSCRSCCTT